MRLAWMSEQDAVLSAERIVRRKPARDVVAKRNEKDDLFASIVLITIGVVGTAIFALAGIGAWWLFIGSRP